MNTKFTKNMITWKFENIDVTFKSQPENFVRDTMKMAHANHLPLETKIIVIDGTPTEPIPTGDGDTATDPQPTLSKSAKRAKTKSETSELQSVSGDVVESDPTPDDVEYTNGGFDPDSTGDRLAL